MGTRIADYFVISGLDVSSGLEPDQLSGDNLHCHPLERPFKSKVLAFYPENTPGNPFDRNAVGMLCHPKGLRFQIQKDKCDTKFHSFLITKEDGSRVYGACLTFYEQVDDRQICSAMDTLQAMHMAELSNAQSRTLYSHLGHVHSRSPKRSVDPQITGKLYDLRRDTLYSTKCIALISQLPLIASLEQLLRDLLEVALNTSKEPDLPLESYVYNILYEIPMPPPGRSMKLQTAMRSIIGQRPGLNELPLFDFPLREMFHLLGVDNVINLFSSVLLETQILLYSKDYQRLMIVAEGITSLLFPFSWQHVYVPILPASLLHFLDAPVPFIMGLHHTTDGQSLLKHCSTANMCFVDIDQGTLEMPEDLPTFPYKQDLKEELLLHLNFQFDHLDGSMRDSGFRDSFPPCDSGLSSESGSAASSTWSLASRLELLQQSEALAKITALAKKTGVISSLEDINESWRLETDSNKSRPMDKHMQEMVCNNYIREIFLHYFLQIFSSYESFVILPGGDMESWISNRESMQTYDKAAYLSDQPLSHLPFLSAFIETQMFTTMIDNKILAQWEDEDPQLRVFEARLRYFKEKTGDQREPQHHRHSMCRDSETLLEKRANLIDIVAPSPKLIDVPQKQGAVPPKPGNFPLLNFSVLHKETQIARTKREGVRWRKRDRLHHHSEHLRLSLDSREKHKSLHQPKLADLNPAHVAQTNWKFVETLLKEVKAKTKRMLVAKMGQEAVELGHGEMTVTGVEENTLIASLCDLLERIWSHGLQKNNKGGKSALWSHLLSYQEVEEAALGDAIGTDPNLLSPGMMMSQGSYYMGANNGSRFGSRAGSRAESRSESRSCSRAESRASSRAESRASSRASSRAGSLGGSPSASGCSSPSTGQPPLNIMSTVTDASDLSNSGGESEPVLSGTQTWPVRRHKRKPSRGPELPVLSVLPIEVLFDMRNVQQMPDIKTEVGYARAWVRLSLEKKLLSRHLKQLLSNTQLLRNLYKRYAFLRCEDEREQFLYHLLSLNAVDYHCFTNTFPNTMVPYRVLIFTRQNSGKLGGSSTTANGWFTLAGQLGETSQVPIPKHTLDIGLQHKNLGVLTTLRIGHDNAGMSPRWLVEHVVVRNEITGHTYRFPCGRWLGKGVDDGSTERLLVAEAVPSTCDHSELMEKCRTPPRCRSPSMPRRSNEPRMSVSTIQEQLGDAVNNLVKHYFKPEKERGSVTGLLCGEYGLVFCMEHVYQCGFKSARFLRNRFFIWDFLEKVATYFEGALRGEEPVEMTTDARKVISRYCHVISTINSQASQTVGKDGRFQLFICIGVRDKVLHRWVKMISKTPVTASMYEERSFLRDPNLLTFLIQILESLKDFNVVLEASLIKGIDL